MTTDIYHPRRFPQVGVTLKVETELGGQRTSQSILGAPVSVKETRRLLVGGKTRPLVLGRAVTQYLIPTPPCYPVTAYPSLELGRDNDARSRPSTVELMATRLSRFQAKIGAFYPYRENVTRCLPHSFVDRKRSRIPFQRGNTRRSGFGGQRVLHAGGNTSSESSTSMLPDTRLSDSSGFFKAGSNLRVPGVLSCPEVNKLSKRHFDYYRTANDRLKNTATHHW